MLVELVKLHIIKLKIILRYRPLLIITIIHLLLTLNFTYSENPDKINEYGYIKFREYNEETEFYKYYINNAIFYSKDVFEVGTYINIEGSCESSKQTNFIDFDYSKYLSSKKIECVLFDFTITKSSKVNYYYKLKYKIYENVRESDFYGLKNAIIFGNRANLDEETNQIFYDMHIAHLLALSGMHLSLLTIYTNFILKRIFKSEEVISTLLFLIISMYGLLVTMSYSITRTLLIYYIGIIFIIIKKRISKLTIFLITLNTVLFLNHNSVYSYSFIYSFICYFIVIVFINKKPNFLKLYFYVLIFILPIMINLGNSINLVGLILAPFISIMFELIYFPYLLITTIFSIPDYFSKFFISGLQFVCNDTFTYIIGDLPLWIVFLYYLVVYLIINKSRKIILILLLIFLITFNFIVPKNQVEIMIFDVDQGDAMLISYQGLNILVDSGGSGYSESKNESFSKYIIIPYLKEKGINKLDYIISTHGDYDHSGSLLYLVNNFKYEKLYINCNEVNELEKKFNYEQLLEYNIELKNFKINFSCTNNNDENNSSIILKGKFFNTTFLSMGDLGYEYEEKIVEHYDILKVSHHGSNTSTSEEFIKNVSPYYAIISVGENNYGHPSENVLLNLSSSIIYRTDLNGAILVIIDEDGLVINSKIED